MNRTPSLVPSLIAALGPRGATITATTDGKRGTATVTVVLGAF